MSMRFLVAGSSGFLGRSLTGRVRESGHQVRRLVRGDTAAADAVRWDPDTGRLDPSVVEDADVVVNLAGAPLVGNVFSARWARQVHDSRVRTTRVLAEAVAASGHRPVFLAQNGISYYGDHGDAVVTEDSDSRGDALLTRVARDWQAATAAAAGSGARVCVLRTAPVYDVGSPPLKQLRLLFRTGLGARLGSGRQYTPVISLRDWLAAVLFLAEDPGASGPFNLCCPVTPTNVEVTESLAEAAGVKARLAAPGWLLTRATGALAPELLGSVNAAPAALQAAGYRFRDPDVRAVLAAALGRR